MFDMLYWFNNQPVKELRDGGGNSSEEKHSCGLDSTFVARESIGKAVAV